MKRAVIAVIAVIAILAPDSFAQARLWDPDERVTITSFNEIQALTFEAGRLYAATSNGLEIYDADRKRWLLPSTSEDGYPIMERAVALQYDRTQAGLWLIAASGNAYLWSELSKRWDLRLDRPNRQDRQERPENDAAFDILRRTLTTDPLGRRFRITATARADRPGTYWVGTHGGNIMFADARNWSGEWLGFGTLSQGIAAIATDNRGDIWFGSDGYGLRNGITRADSTLQTWTSYEAYDTRAPRTAVTRILAGDTIWTASAEGVHVLSAGARAWQNIGEREGLPSEVVRAIVRGPRGVWAGTDRGLAFIDSRVLRVTWRGLDGVRIRDLAERGDTVWIASDRGLWIATADTAGVVRVDAAPGTGDPRLRSAITSVARVGERIAALVNGNVYLYESGWSNPLLLNAASRAYALRGDSESLYLLHRDGVEEWHAATNTTSHLSAPGDIPESPHDVLRVGANFWIATPSGAVRLRSP
ncbi:MAG: hypothetical protein ACT4O1_04525 [Gemmatimonadota bacterium]